MDNNADLSTTGSTVNYSYSTDSGSTWVAATATTDGSKTLRLPVPSGYVDLDTNVPVSSTIVTSGTQILVHPDRADLNLEIMKDSYISVNNVGKDIFGGYYKGKPALDSDTNLFDMGRLWPGMARAVPFLSYLPRRGPTTMAPARAIQPPTE